MTTTTAAPWTPCQEPKLPRGLWTSEKAADRAEAAGYCPFCPVVGACLAAAIDLEATFGVWAGHDMGTPAGRQAARAAHAAARGDA